MTVPDGSDEDSQPMFVLQPIHLHDQDLYQDWLDTKVRPLDHRTHQSAPPVVTALRRGA